TSSPTVTVTLAATDAAGVTGYWLAIGSSPAPTGTSIGWTAVTPTQTFNASVPYTFPFTSDGNKPLYGWYKDAAGNVSAIASASIILDRTVPSNGTLTASAGYGLVNLSWTGFSDSGSGLSPTSAYTIVSSTSGTPSSCSSGAGVTTLYTG